MFEKHLGRSRGGFCISLSESCTSSYCGRGQARQWGRHLQARRTHCRAEFWSFEMHDLRRPRSVAAFPCEVRPCRLASTSTTCQSVAKPPSSILKSGISYISHVLEFAWIGQIDFQCHSHSHTYQILPTIRSFFETRVASTWVLPTLNENFLVSGNGKKGPKKVFQPDDIFLFFLLQITDWNKTALKMNASLEWLFL